MDNYSSANLRLINSNSGQENHYILSTNKPNLIGRSPECQVILNPQEFITVSRIHAQIEFISQDDRGYWQITDNYTTNGTLINGEKITDSYILKSGDRIILGLKGPEFIFETEIVNSILNSTVLVELTEEESTILEIVKEEEITEESIEEIEELNQEDIEEIIEDSEEIIEELKIVEVQEQKEEIIESKQVVITPTEIIVNIPTNQDKLLSNIVEENILPTEIIDNVTNKNIEQTKTEIISNENIPNFSVENKLATTTIWNLFNFQEITHIEAEQNSIQCLALSDDQKMIVSGGNDNLVKLWNIEEREEIASFSGHKMAVNGVSISPDNKLIVSGGNDKLVKLWNIEDRKEIASFSSHKMAVNGVSISSDNKLIASGSSDKLVKLWSVEDEKEIASFTGHKTEINTVVFNHNNELIASSGGDQLIKLWNIKTKAEEKTVKAEFKFPITGLFFHPNNTSIICISQQDQKVSLIDLDSELELFSFHIPSKLSDLKFISMNGSFFLSIKDNKMLINQLN
ncbi:FHA domain-containing protein [Geminocystis sp. NIES-3709]|uniref:FHA domain-containing protein n=1 Tax=Geminocystis sp. NIES-3709 TaxID=1617448 RepID=UPI0005FC8310|nr:FHA domain-containing protein [Geminocystis sp. NIES-3709]BAQ65312.1 high-affnity carbon uptake protein Hat/HatR [Geminocystis sp. NIES-3709]